MNVFNTLGLQVERAFHPFYFRVFFILEIVNKSIHIDTILFWISFKKFKQTKIK